MKSIPIFHLSNFELSDDLLGSGGFCEIREITFINHIDPKVENSNEYLEVLLKEFENNNTDRPVIKKIKADLSEEDKPSGIKDLLIEARCLRILSHENIICIRGRASTNQDEFFLILDRIYLTLDQQIEKWKEKDKPTRTLMSTIHYSKSVKNVIKHLFADRLNAAYGISSAMEYIHEKEIIYRDLKPQNIGFDSKGVLKIFDFGLAKELDPDEKVGDNFMLTGMTGTLRYMAPEVFREEPYNLAADVYSFGIVLWYIFALRVPFNQYSAAMYRRQVVENFFRPKIDSAWGTKICKLIAKCWSPDPNTRPTFLDICNILTEHKELHITHRGTLGRSQRSKFL